jgi:hypothetical protein
MCLDAIGRELLEEGLVEPAVEGGKRRAAGNARIHGVTKRFFHVRCDVLFRVDEAVPTAPTEDEKQPKSGNTPK